MKLICWEIFLSMSMVGVTLINATLGREENPDGSIESLRLPDAFLCDVGRFREEFKLNAIRIRNVHIVSFVI